MLAITPTLKAPVLPTVTSAKSKPAQPFFNDSIQTNTIKDIASLSSKEAVGFEQV